MADGLNRVGAGVDDGEHGRDYPEKDAGNNAGDGGDVELVDQELSLQVEDSFRSQHLLRVMSVPQAEIKTCLAEKEAHIDGSIGFLLIVCGSLTLRCGPVVGI